MSLPSLDPSSAELDAGRMVCAAIDIPIGLAGREPRACDVEARRLLGPAPQLGLPGTGAGRPRRLHLRGGLRAVARAPAARGSRSSSSTSCPRSARSTRCSRPGCRTNSSRCARSSSFADLTGRAHARPTSGRPRGVPTAAGPGIAAVFGETVRGILDRPPPAGAKRDDVLDALIGAWTARRRAAGTTCSSAATWTHGACAWRSSPDRRVACHKSATHGTAGGRSLTSRSPLVH